MPIQSHASAVKSDIYVAIIRCKAYSILLLYHSFSFLLFTAPTPHPLTSATVSPFSCLTPASRSTTTCTLKYSHIGIYYLDKICNPVLYVKRHEYALVHSTSALSYSAACDCSSRVVSLHKHVERDQTLHENTLLLRSSALRSLKWHFSWSCYQTARKCIQ